MTTLTNSTIMTNQTTNDQQFIVKSAKPDNTLPLPKVSVAKMMAENIIKYDKNIPALIEPNNNGNVTYGQLHERATQFATALLKLGVVSTDFVMFYGENSFEYIIAMLATIYLGLSFCPIPPTSGPFELSEQSSGAEGTVLVFGSEKVVTVEKTATEAAYLKTMKQFKVIVQVETGATGQSRLDALKQLDVFKESNAFIHSFEEMISLAIDDYQGQHLKTIPHFPVDDLEQEFLLCFTSGTTGTPKPALHSHRSIGVSMVRSNWGPKSVGMPVILWHPLGHISGTFISLFSFYAGCSVILFDKSDIEPILQAVEKYKVSYFLMAANQAAPMATLDFHTKYNLSSLKFITHGGSFVATSLLMAIRKKYNVATINIYGSTEFLDCVEGFGVQDLDDDYQVGCVGQVKPGVEMKIVDLESGFACPPNVNGEICFRGASCFNGYKGNEEATRMTIVDGWYHSGDVGYYQGLDYVLFSYRIHF